MEITQGLRGPSGEAEGAQIPRDTTNEICNIIAQISDLLQQAPLQHYWTNETCDIIITQLSDLLQQINMSNLISCLKILIM